MLKILRRYIDFDLVQFALALAALHFFLFNTATFIYKFQHIHAAGILPAILELVKDFIYNIIILVIIFLGLMVHRYVLVAGSLLLFIIGAIASYYLFFFSITPTITMMPAIFGTNPTEIAELVSIKLMLWILFSIVVCICALRHFKLHSTKSFCTKIITMLCLFITIHNIISPKFGIVKTTFPMQYLHNGYIYFFGAASQTARVDISNKFTFQDLNDDDIVGVLVIGESARYSNFGINGYSRNTTPHLAKIDIANFRARSCASTTHLSVPCMLSRYNEQELDKVNSETSFLSVLTKLGFNTMLIGTQSITKHYRTKSTMNFYDDINFYIIPGGTITMLPGAHDERILPYLEQNIATTGKKFVVLHTTGSHWNYKARYPREFAQFQPEINNNIQSDPTNHPHQELINSYDNSILYTDFFLSRVISQLENKKAFLLYSSDHGESLGDFGRFMHGFEEYAAEQRQVPFIVWASDSYKLAHPEKWAAIKAKLGQDISHDYIFHTILDCLNIQSEAIEHGLSLCHSHHDGV